MEVWAILAFAFVSGFAAFSVLAMLRDGNTPLPIAVNAVVSLITFFMAACLAWGATL